jgi:predicted glycoside hydrolase/deacetylase ChbG (UPF0249 family)
LLSNAPEAGFAVQQWKQLELERQSRELPSGERRRCLGDPDRPFDLGVHLNLTQGRPLSGDRYPRELLDANGCFPGVFGLFVHLIRDGCRFRAALQDELERQIGFLRDHGIKPTHLNGHQYVEMMPETRSIVPILLQRFAIPSVRVPIEPSLWRSVLCARFQPWKCPMGWLKQRFARRFLEQVERHGIAHADRFCGTMHAGRVDMRLIRSFLHGREKASLVEIGLHPAAPVEGPAENGGGGWNDPLASARSNELQLLVSDELAEFVKLEGLRLGRVAVMPQSSHHCG